MADTRRKTGPTPTRKAAQAAARSRGPASLPWDMPETPAQTARIRSLQGGGRARAAALFATEKTLARVAREVARRFIKGQG